MHWSVLNRQARIEAIEEQLKPSFKPNLNKKSKVMSKDIDKAVDNKVSENTMKKFESSPSKVDKLYWKW